MPVSRKAPTGHWELEWRDLQIGVVKLLLRFELTPEGNYNIRSVNNLIFTTAGVRASPTGGGLGLVQFFDLEAHKLEDGVVYLSGRISSIPHRIATGNGLFEFEAEVRGQKLEGRAFRVIDELRGYTAASFTGRPRAGNAPLRDYKTLAGQIKGALQGAFFDPSRLATGGFAGLFAGRGPSANALDDLDFQALYFIGSQDTSSYPIFVMSTQEVEELGDDLPAYEGLRPVEQFPGGIVLVRPMDLTSPVFAEELATAMAGQPRGLILDLRYPLRQTLAWRNLANLLYGEPKRLGAAFGQGWFAPSGRRVQRDREPNVGDVRGARTFAGEDFRAFASGVAQSGAVALEAAPAGPAFAGPVFVLVDGDTEGFGRLLAFELRGRPGVKLYGDRSRRAASYVMGNAPLGQGLSLTLPVGVLVTTGGVAINEAELRPDVTRDRRTVPLRLAGKKAPQKGAPAGGLQLADGRDQLIEQAREDLLKLLDPPAAEPPAPPVDKPATPPADLPATPTGGREAPAD